MPTLHVAGRPVTDEQFNAVTMLPGYLLAASWPTQSSCVWVGPAYALVCSSSIAYHLTNHRIGRLDMDMFRYDIMSQLLCCATITANHANGTAGGAFIMGCVAAVACATLRRTHMVTIAALAILITNGPYFDSAVAWVVTFGTFVASKALNAPWLHGAFHVCGHVATHLTVKRTTCYVV